MELSKITELMKEPEKLIDGGQINLLSSYTGGFISHFEEQLNEENYQVSAKWKELRETVKTDTKADREIELSDIYRQREKTKLTIAQLKRFRADLLDRFRVVTFKRY